MSRDDLENADMRRPGSGPAPGRCSDGRRRINGRRAARRAPRPGLLCVLGAMLLALSTAPGARAQAARSLARAPQTDRHAAAIEAGRTILETLMRGANLPGLQVAVGLRGERVWSDGFGYADLEQGVPVTPLTRFRIGSIGKPLTAAAAVKLYEEGRLDLDAPIWRYVPEFPGGEEPITARQLAGHLAGIRHYHEDEERVRYSSYTNVLDALAIFADDSLLHPPGTAYEYSSYGYNLLSAVIQGASGTDFLTYMRDGLFRPLGMRHTVADHVDSIIPYRAAFYEGSHPDGRLLNAPFTDNSYKWAAGGFLSTAEDLARFASGLAAGELVAAARVDEMFTSMTTASGDTTGYGMGWRIRTDWQGRRVVRHGGSSVGGRAFLMLYPEARLAIAILVNASRAPVFHEEAQTLAHLFLDHPVDAEAIGVAGETIAGVWSFRAPRGDEEVAGTLHFTGSRTRPGWMNWEGAAAPVPLVLIDRHGAEWRVVGAGVHGMLNLWLEIEEGSFTGRWDWLGRTSEIEGRRVTGR